ncbi:PQQ-binding-like beta-propeller repeat protein [Rhodococcus sp. IEGM 1379]|uniref:outer membrane protein assembly factor BamB family protein n=1 Tax=Rhodococcus sp. IEGM 1379 TaxID=3047086 RepID=UPI0024B665DD|nr:PQQ-binding-like beta-propeller repeat protein [Rhodococcus sp. IEGM 1379]MDI9919063.1 PQQ-binding-like beta-propeller repeat protein [Rhodococcus sp. IEGM 1379]
MKKRLSAAARLRISAVAAALAVTAAVFTVVDIGGRAHSTTEGTPVWSVDAADVLGREFAVFSSPIGGTQSNMTRGGLVDAGSTVVTLVGMPDRRRGVLDGAELVGLDAADGSVRWRSAAADIAGCSPALLEESVLCMVGESEYGEGLAIFDLKSGERKDIRTPWNPIAVVADQGDILALEGNIEDNDVRVHSGTVDNPEGNWSKAFDVGGYWESGFSGPLLSVHGDLGVISLDESLGFDVGTGEQRWRLGYTSCTSAHTSPDGVTSVSDDGCDGSTPSVYALDSRGVEIARETTVGSRNSGSRYLLDQPSDKSRAIILGSSGFDRTTGKRLWTNEEVFGNASSLSVIDGVVAVAGRGSEPVQFVDLATGEVLWQSSAPRVGEVAWNGVPVVDEGMVYGLDPRTGQRTWEVQVEPDARVEFGGWAMRELWSGENVVVRASEDRLTALRTR